MKVELNKSLKERILHAILFEILANSMIAVLITILLGVSLVQSSSLSTASAAIAMLWNYISNYIFDKIQHRYGFQRTFKVRVIHACFFEAVLIFSLLPVAMYFLDLTILSALAVETGLVAFFLPYTLLFNWIYDYVRWQMVGK